MTDEPTEGRWTRRCFDPWTGVDVRAGGGVAPCCNRPPVARITEAPLREIRASAAFRALRASLLSGRLDDECRKCHIREKVPVEAFPPMAQRWAQWGDPAAPGELRDVRVDINERCNLRCVYCAVSQPGYAGVEMAPETLEAIVRALSFESNITHIAVNGHGETTYHPGWREFCERLLAQRLPLSIITNFARRYADEELDVLSRFSVVQISIDSADPDLLGEIRRRVDLGTITLNLARLRATALARQRPLPTLAFSCGLYDRNVLGLERLAWLAVACGVRLVTFWNLVKYPDVPGSANVSPLAALESTALVRALDAVDRAIDILTRHGIEVDVAGSFLDDLRARAGRGS